LLTSDLTHQVLQSVGHRDGVAFPLIGRSGFGEVLDALPEVHEAAPHARDTLLVGDDFEEAHAKEVDVSAILDERPRLLTIRELAAYLSVPVSTIYGWRYTGEGPRGMKVGRLVRYRAEDVDRWLELRSDESGGGG
jgi:excisionase family DNA binding protein